MAISRAGDHHGVVTGASRRAHALAAAAGLATWGLASLPTWLSAQASPRLPGWAAACVLGACALVVTAPRERLDRVMVAGLAAQSAAVVTMVALLCNGFEGMLLVVVAAQLGRVAALRVAVAWIIVQTLTVATAIGVHWTPRAAITRRKRFAISSRTVVSPRRRVWT